MHKLLKRQIKRHLGSRSFEMPESQSFLAAVNDAYEQAYMDYNMLEHAMDLASEELRQKNEKLEEEVARRKEAQKEIERLNHQIEMILNYAGEGIVGINSNGIITFLNPAAESLLGSNSKNLVGKGFHDHVHHSKPDGSPLNSVDCPIYETICSGVVNNNSDDIFWKGNGTSFPVEYISSPIRDGGKIEGAVVTFKDVSSRKEIESTLKLLNVILDRRVQERTQELKKAYEIQKNEIAERKKVEMELKQLNEKAKSASRAKSEFMAKIGHELRTPTKHMIEVSERLKNRISDGLDSQTNLPDARNLADFSKNLLRLIDDVLQISDIETGNVKVDSQSVNIKELIEEVLVAVEPQAREKRVTFRTQFPDDLGSMIQADPERLRQVMFHVINNSIKFNKLNGFVLIVANHAQENGFLTLEIFDSGVGIPEEKQKSIFEPFYKGQKSANGSNNGTGIGLSISKQLMELMGGRIGINSIENEGSCVSLSLPIHKDNVKQSILPKDSTPSP